jgi:hypothetical protein
MAISQIDLCSRALVKLGAGSISSFEDGTLEAEIAAGLYPIVRDSLLSVHPWNFATMYASPSLLAAAPIAEFSSAFLLPSDCLRVISAGTGTRARGLTYKIVGRELHTDAAEIVVCYVGRPPEVAFPPFFDATLIAQLAAEFCIPLTESTSRWESLRRAAELELQRARLIDAQEETPTAVEDFSLIEGRF